MKKLFLFVFSLVLAVLSYAQVPVKPNQPYVKTVDANTYYSTKIGADSTFLKVVDAIVATDYFYTKQQAEALKNGNNFLEALQRFGTTIKAVPIGIGINSLMNGTSVLTDGAVYYIAFDVADTIVSTGVNYVLNVAGNFTGDNYNGFGLFSVSGGTYTKITQTVTDDNVWKASPFTLATKAWPTPQTLLPGVYMIALQWSASSTTTAPTIYTWGTLTANHALILTNSNKISGYVTSQTALPATSTTGSALTVSSVLYGIWLY